MTKNFDKLTKYYKEKKGALKEETKLEKSKLATEKFEVKQKEKKSKKISKILNKLSKPITYRKILKKNKMSVHIPEYKAPSVLGDPNRFFKNELANERRNMFFQ